MGQVYADAASAVDGLLADNLLIAAEGCGLCGLSELPTAAIRDSGVREMTMASNNTGADEFGLGQLMTNDQSAKLISSHGGENAEVTRQDLAGELQVELPPQGRLAEKKRAGSDGIPAFNTRSGSGTQTAEGKPQAEFDGQTCVPERAPVADIPTVKAWKTAPTGNLVFRKTARNVNVPAATCGRICIAEVEKIVPAGSFGPDLLHLPGVYVHRLLEGRHEKRGEQRARSLA